MRIEQSGTTTVVVEATLQHVLQILSDPAEVADFVAPLLDDRSTSHRWVVEPVRIGPMVVRPVTAVEVRRQGRDVHVVGRPVPEATPTHLSVAMKAVERQPVTRVEASWWVAVDLRGPQFVARIARPLLAAEARFVTDDLSRRLVARFDGT